MSQTHSIMDKLRELIAEAREEERRALWLVPPNDQSSRGTAWRAYKKAQALADALTNAAENYLS